jgi:hypothetical protein
MRTGEDPETALGCGAFAEHASVVAAAENSPSAVEGNPCVAMPHTAGVAGVAGHHISEDAGASVEMDDGDVPAVVGVMLPSSKATTSSRESFITTLHAAGAVIEPRRFARGVTCPDA